MGLAVGTCTQHLAVLRERADQAGICCFDILRRKGIEKSVVRAHGKAGYEGIHDWTELDDITLV